MSTKHFEKVIAICGGDAELGSDWGVKGEASSFGHKLLPCNFFLEAQHSGCPDPLLTPSFLFGLAAELCHPRKAGAAPDWKAQEASQPPVLPTAGLQRGSERSRSGQSPDCGHQAEPPSTSGLSGFPREWEEPSLRVTGPPPPTRRTTAPKHFQRQVKNRSGVSHRGSHGPAPPLDWKQHPRGGL